VNEVTRVEEELNKSKQEVRERELALEPFKRELEIKKRELHEVTKASGHIEVL